MAEQTAAPGERTPGLPDRAKAFLSATGLAAAAVSASAILHGGETHGWTTFAALVIGASIAQLFAFHTIRNQVFHTTPLFFVAGAMLLPPQLLVLIPLLSHLPDWIRKRYAWYIQTFNILNFTLAIMCAWFAVRVVDGAPALSGRWAAGAALAAAAYVLLNNTGFIIVLYLARGHRPSEILSPQTLSGVAELIRAELRQYDVGARIAGDEFAVLLPETGTPVSHEIAERLRTAVADTPIWAESASRYVNVTLSVGIASFPGQGTDPDELL